MKSKDEARDRLLKAIKHFLQGELILADFPNDTHKKMKERVNWFVNKIVEMKKDLK